MKFLIDKLPDCSRKCIFSVWHPYPPIVEQPGYYECTKCGKECNLTAGKTECYLLKEGRYE